MKKDSLIHIDGAQGEGGGQVLRTSLALSVVTGRPFRITQIRANRKKPGLMRQHLTSVRAAAEVAGGSVLGAELHSQELTFTPSRAGAFPGTYHFAIGTAGSTSLVLQTILLPLLLAEGESTVTLEGGTHNPMAPPFPFLEKVFVPALRRMGASIDLTMERPGFMPAGGGLVHLQVRGGAKLGGFELLERGEVQEITATAVTAGGLSGDIAKRELQAVAEKLTVSPERLLQRKVTDSIGPGTFVCIEVRSDNVTELFTAIGQLGKKAETVGHEAANEARDYLAAGVPVGPHLADQLLLPMALGEGGSFITNTPTLHTKTNIDVIRHFLEVPIALEQVDGSRNWKISVG